MDAPSDVNTAELTGAVPIATQSTYVDDQQTATTHETQGRIGNRGIRHAISSTMADEIMDDTQLHIAHPERAHHGNEGSNINATHHSDNEVGLFVGVQDSVLRVASNETENGSEMQELGDGGNSPIPYSGNMAGDGQDDDEAMDNNLPPANAEVSGVGPSVGPPLDQSIDLADNDSPNEGIFAEMLDPDTEHTEVESDGDAEVDNDGERSAPERDPEINQHSYIGSNNGTIHDCSRTRQIIAEHLSIQGQQTFESLDDLLSSHNAPGRGLYKIEEVVEEKKKKAAELKEDIRCLKAQLDVVSELRDEARTVMIRACMNFSDTCGAAGISNELWAEYEAFCESLESKLGSRDGWSVTCFQNHNNSYIHWDPDLDLFKETAEMPLEDCNFRCEASTINKNGSTEYVVEFWPLFRLEPREGTAKTWEQQYPKLYQLAKEAVHKSLGDNTVTQELLLSLPNPNLPFTSGWMLEYAPEPAKASHNTLSRRWSYRRACRIPVAGQQDPPKSYLATTSESNSTTSKDMEMDYEWSEESSESQDVNMEDHGSESAESLVRDSEET
ncbi:hypothetical protein KVR01_006758 [Diaporthe batatas]|uniref:uncharacterized protein n=1 Tax=Diaporthe batatas TaxID=748121 RepID=UPI001D05786F|nr:uncharacterized protein KVR01_006758 [Diaporthe batatas]KAG8163461.1 hypothetical protein KVR01_006758 [Diaporthe batatas]